MEANKSTLVQLPPRNRGKHTDTFKKIKVTTNHYQVAVKEMQNIFIFSVRYTPLITYDNTSLRMKLLHNILDQIKYDQIASPVLSGNNIYSLEAPSSVESSYVTENHEIKVKQVKVFQLAGNPKLLLGFLNNGLRNVMNKLNYSEVGRSGKYFNSSEKVSIDNLIMLNGYKVNFVYLEKGYFLRVDPAKKIIRDQTALDVIDKIYKSNQKKDKLEKRNLVMNELVNKIVMSNYGKTRYHKVADILFAEVNTIVLEGEDKESLTLMDYYLKKYNIAIGNPKQPLLITESRHPQKPIYLIPELMNMTGIPDNFDQQRRKKISQKTIRAPNEKMSDIHTIAKKLNSDESLRSLEGLGINLKGTQPEVIEAKQIPVPQLQLGKNNTVERGKEAFFNLFNKPIFQAKHDIPCTVIHSRNGDVKELVEVMQRTSKNLGVSMTIQVTQVSSPTLREYEQKINTAIEKGIKICCVVIPISLKTSYKALKLFSLAREIPTQFVTEQTLRKKGFQSVATKILLQIIAKRGNILWVPSISKEVPFSAMLVGFEQAKVGNKTLLVICATINSTHSSIFTDSKVYEGNDNKFKAMQELLCEAVRAYFERNKRVPEQIFTFQNTCSGDQVSLYHDMFVDPFIQKICELYKDSNVALTVVMVNVKTNERFVLKNGERVENVPAGTLINSELVSHNYDFYLVSQKSNKGTAVPNHYRVIFTNSKVEEGILEEMVFSQCFNYVNWTGSIKVPSILQYAKKASTFLSDVMGEQKVPESLHTRLYYV